MPISSNIPHDPQSRFWLAIAAFTLLTPLLLHPSVPQALRSLQELGLTLKMQNIGYLAHILAYFVASILVLTILQPRTIEHSLLLLSALLTHGVATEIAQLWIPARDFDTLDLFCNVTSIVLGWVVWQLCLKPHTQYASRLNET